MGKSIQSFTLALNEAPINERFVESVELGQERSSTAEDDAHIIMAVNHALITRSWFIHQTYVPVSLEIKDTVVRSYRIDHVQNTLSLISTTTPYRRNPQATASSVHRPPYNNQLSPINLPPPPPFSSTVGAFYSSQFSLMQNP
ncbi:hypothetical protein MTR_7g007390 [Medicago truncatula]|uniref:Uncharacterized protein n=1 Tax=Medicago truncatula TaxID=3880 RepID=A0A072TXG2_MEDTR|nr:hypothetical protein MTR_7g007390 [Medicago truncatula]